jgi:hypothetical protein
LENPSVDVRMILKWMLQKLLGMTRTELIWPKISGGLLCMR